MVPAWQVTTPGAGPGLTWRRSSHAGPVMTLHPGPSQYRLLHRCATGKVRHPHRQSALCVFSAIDCPACKKIEDQFAQNGDRENTTFFVIPSSLQDSELQWQKVANIWCATDSAAAWKKYWATGATPAAGACSFADGHLAEKMSYYVWDMLKGAGLALHGTPAYLREDGLLLTRATLDMPLQPSGPAYWLANVDPLYFLRCGWPVTRSGEMPEPEGAILHRPPGAARG